MCGVRVVVVGAHVLLLPMMATCAPSGEKAAPYGQLTAPCSVVEMRSGAPSEPRTPLPVLPTRLVRPTEIIVPIAATIRSTPSNTVPTFRSGRCRSRAILASHANLYTLPIRNYVSHHAILSYGGSNHYRLEAHSLVIRVWPFL